MWANVCCSKYSHSRVTSFKTHLRHNNHFGKLRYEESHLPHHMRLSLGGRIIRFLFYPICLAGSVMFLNNYNEFKTMKNYCAERNKCFSFCTSDNFPDLLCKSVEVDITYNNNEYKEFFTYPNPGFG